MKKILHLFIVCLSVLLICNNKMIAQDGISFPASKKLPEVKIYSSGKYEPFIIKARNRKKAGAEPTAKFEVTYHNFSNEAKEAFAKAVENWSYLVSSTVTIKIDATWEALDQGVLGSASASSYRRDFKNATEKLTWYPIAIANKLAGYDLEPDNQDITARFSNEINWYLGTDGNCTAYQYDFISVVMHEIGHGLGFIGSANVENNLGSWGGGTKIPFIFDRFVYNGSDDLLMDTLTFENPSTELETQYTSGNVYFHSFLSDEASGGHAKLYAPSSWNDGSSYSHLDEIYNGTDDAMMTYSAGTGEVTHHPGSITLGMFAEMGWISVLFKHHKIKDIETMPNPITVEAEIFSDSLLIDGSVYLHYSIDNFATKTTVAMSTSNDTLYTASIPVQAADTVKYYFEATTKLNRTYYYPVQKEPSPTPDTTLYFAIGSDNIKPIVKHEPPKSIFNFNKTLDLIIYADDNQGINSVAIDYRVNNGSLQALSCSLKEFSEVENLFVYETSIDIESLNDGDTIYYSVKANDIASTPNDTVLPSEGFFKVAILDLGTPTQDLTIDFDDASHPSMFYEQGLAISQPEEGGFTSKAIHSPHPYDEGKNHTGNEIEYSIMLKTPIIIKNEDAFMRFDEIVIVEPGETNAAFGSADFYDYVVIEGSLDSGKTWHAFEDGYDCGVATTFTTAYNGGSDGTESMYISNLINLLGNSNIKGGDKVLIRFRLWSDYGASGWGWAIDNLEIQGEVTSTKTTSINPQSFKVYPSPSDGNFEIELSTKEPINEYKIAVYNLIGENIYESIKKTSSNLLKQQINISNAPSGVYFLKVNYNDQLITKKIIKK